MAMTATGFSMPVVIKHIVRITEQLQLHGEDEGIEGSADVCFE